MKRGMKMLAMTTMADRSREGGSRNNRDYGRSDMRYGDMEYETTRNEYNGAGMNYGVEGRFRDRRGREHYDDGRFAPMRSAMEEPESRRYRRYSDGRFAPRSDMDEPEDRYGGRYGTRSHMPDYDVWYSPDMNRNGGERDMMAGFSMNGGFRNEGMDATYQPMNEMERRGGMMAGGGAKSEAIRPFDKQMAEEWTGGMENEDGTHGAHWTLEQAKQIMAQRSISADPFAYWAVLNSIYSDYSKVLKKYNLGDRLDVYADLADAWLKDKDAVKDKASAYFTYVVKR